MKNFKMIQIPVTEGEYLILKEKASELNMTIREYVKSKVIKNVHSRVVLNDLDKQNIIIKRTNEKWSFQKIADYYKVSKSNIYKIVNQNKQSYTEVKDTTTKNAKAQNHKVS
jgi:hypothetical protein